MNLRTAIIPVAGLGTRFLPITKVVPKELLPLVDRPIIEYIIDEAKSSGIKNIVLVNSRGKAAIEDYFDFEFDEARFAHKKDLIARSHAIAKEIKVISLRQHKALGLGHAILCAKPAIREESFAVLLGDDVIDANPPCTRQLMDIHEARGGAPVVGVMEVEKSEVAKYGIVGGKDLGSGLIEVDQLVEKPPPADAPSRLAIPGRYILTSDIFPILEQTQPAAGGEIQLTDALCALAKKRKLYAYKFKGERFDAGNQAGFLEANIHFALKRPELKDSVLAILERFRKGK